MRRTAVLAVFLAFAIILAGCGGHTVDEELLPTRVPTLDPQALAQAAVESMPTPRPTATDTPIPPTPTPEPTATSTPVLPAPILEPTAEPELSATESSTESNTTSGADPVTATATITDTTDATSEAVEPTDEVETADVPVDQTGDQAGDQTSEEPESEQAPVAASEAVTDTIDVVDTVPDIEGEDVVTDTEALSETTDAVAEGETVDVTGDQAGDQTSEEPESEQEPVAASEAVTDTTDVVDTVPDIEGEDVVTGTEALSDTTDAVAGVEAEPAVTAEDVDPVLAGMPDSLVTAMADADADNGETLILSTGCTGCHSLDPNQFMAGPTWYNLSQIAADRVEGESAGLYLYHSIVEPNAYVVENYQPNIMLSTYKETLAEDDLADILAYLLTIRGR